MTTYADAFSTIMRGVVDDKYDKSYLEKCESMVEEACIKADQDCDTEQDAYTRGYNDGRGWRNYYTWHYKPKNGWGEEDMPEDIPEYKPEYGKLIIIARYRWSPEYNVCIFYDGCCYDCENGDYICDFLEVDAWEYIQKIKNEDEVKG